jgi:hypothetical protein
VIQRTCSIDSPVPSRATAAANSSSKVRGSGSMKERWKLSYRPALRSSAILLIFCSVGETKYIAGTSGRAGRVECSWLLAQHYGQHTGHLLHLPQNTYTCNVTPTSRKSWTRSTVASTSLDRWSRTRTFHTVGPVSVVPGSAFLSTANGGGALRFRRLRSAAVWAC